MSASFLGPAGTTETARSQGLRDSTAGVGPGGAKRVQGLVGHVGNPVCAGRNRSGTAAAPSTDQGRDTAPQSSAQDFQHSSVGWKGFQEVLLTPVPSQVCAGPDWTSWFVLGVVQLSGGLLLSHHSVGSLKFQAQCCAAPEIPPPLPNQSNFL